MEAGPGFGVDPRPQNPCLYFMRLKAEKKLGPMEQNESDSGVCSLSRRHGARNTEGVGPATRAD